MMSISVTSTLNESNEISLLFVSWALMLIEIVHKIDNIMPGKIDSLSIDCIKIMQS